MNKLVIIYHSVTGVTDKLAAALCAGAGEIDGVSVERYQITGQEIERGRFNSDSCLQLVDGADAVIFGCPTYMGGPSAQFKAFADASSDRWSERRWVGKIAAGFTVGSSLNGDQLNTLLYFGVFAAQHGMLWVGVDVTSEDTRNLNRLGTQFGVAAQSDGKDLPDIDLRTARYLGARVATITSQVHDKEDLINRSMHDRV